MQDGIDSLFPARRLLYVRASQLTSLRTCSNSDVVTEMKIKPQHKSIESATTWHYKREWDLLSSSRIATYFLHTDTQGHWDRHRQSFTVRHSNSEFTERQYVNRTHGSRDNLFSQPQTTSQHNDKWNLNNSFSPCFCLSGQLLPCDAMQAWLTPSCGVCPSVCHVRTFCPNE